MQQQQKRKGNESRRQFNSLSTLRSLPTTAAAASSWVTNALLSVNKRLQNGDCAICSGCCCRTYSIYTPSSLSAICHAVMLRLALVKRLRTLFTVTCSIPIWLHADYTRERKEMMIWRTLEKLQYDDDDDDEWKKGLTKSAERDTIKQKKEWTGET